MKLCEVLDDNDSFRFDSEYFQKEYLLELSIMSKYKLSELVNITNKIDVGFVGSMVNEYTNDGIPLLQTKNIAEVFINTNEYVCINKEFHNKLKKSQICLHDILIARSGSFGKASIYFEKTIVNSSDVIIIQANHLSINCFYLTIFLNSKYGRDQMIRFASGGLQGHVNLTILEKLKVPMLPKNFQTHIENLVISAHRKLEQSKKLYQDAETMLLEELGFNDFSLTCNNIAIKSLSESFSISGRLDAEYYQPKYDAILEKIEQYHNGFFALNDICTLHDANFLPHNETIYNYIELSNIGTNGEIVDCMCEKGCDLPTRARRRIKKGQVIVSTIEGSLQSIAIVDECYDNALCSTGFYIIDSQNINSETLLVLLKNNYMQALLKKRCSGTILTAIGKEEFMSLQIPLIDAVIQQNIASHIQKSFALRSESKQLLAKAKAAVECAIEQGEAYAVDTFFHDL